MSLVRYSILTYPVPELAPPLLIVSGGLLKHTLSVVIRVTALCMKECEKDDRNERVANRKQTVFRGIKRGPFTTAMMLESL